MTALAWAALMLGTVVVLLVLGVAAIRSLNASLWHDLDGIEREDEP